MGCKVGRPEIKHCPLGNPLPSHFNPLKSSAQDSWVGSLEMGSRESPEGGKGEVGTSSVWEIRLTPGMVRGKTHQKSLSVLEVNGAVKELHRRGHVDLKGNEDEDSTGEG